MSVPNIKQNQHEEGEEEEEEVMVLLTVKLDIFDDVFCCKSRTNHAFFSSLRNEKARPLVDTR